MNNHQNHTRTTTKSSSSSTSVDSSLSELDLDVSNNRTIPVTYRFRTRSINAERNNHIKTIAKTALIQSISQPHYVDYIPRSRWHFLFRRRTIRTIDTDHHTVVGPYHTTTYRTNNNNGFHNHTIQNHNKNDTNTNGVVALHHYYTKSLQEFKERCSRGSADLPKSEWNKTMPCQSDQAIMNYFSAPTTNSNSNNNSNKQEEQTVVWDDSAWKLLTTRLPFKYKE